MISYLSGKIKFKTSKSATVDINGVGYEVFLSEPILEKIKIDQDIQFFCYTYVREDILAIYGFSSLEEKQFFELLISVSGVGPKSALQTLNVAKLSEIKKAILRDDPSLLRKVSGIGNKTAERIVVELKNKLEDMPVGKGESLDLSDNTGHAGAFSALQTLGYSPQEIRDALKSVPPDINDENEIIKLVLKQVGKSKE